MKYFEIRDSMTFIPVMAFKPSAEILIPSPAAEVINYGLARGGWTSDSPSIIVCRLTTIEAKGDPYDWPGYSRTMRIAHQHIQDNWYSLNSGDVIDVEHILGEKAEKKKSEAL